MIRVPFPSKKRKKGKRNADSLFTRKPSETTRETSYLIIIGERWRIMEGCRDNYIYYIQQAVRLIPPSPRDGVIMGK